MASFVIVRNTRSPAGHGVPRVRSSLLLDLLPFADAAHVRRPTVKHGVVDPALDVERGKSVVVEV
jgi:hypothetical protein